MVLRQKQSSLPWANAKYAEEFSTYIESMNPAGIARMSEQTITIAPGKYA
jgi:hypothetical protein